MVLVDVRTRNDKKIPIARGLPGPVDVYGSADVVTVLDLKRAIAKNYPKLYVDRQRLTVDGKPLDDNTTIASLGHGDKPTVVVKDLGAQLSWRAVYIVEYLGPLFIHPILYFFQPYFYRTVQPHSHIQTIAGALTVLHFVKRELETIFLHRFSRATMPATYIIRNSAHYWLWTGVAFAYVLYSSTYSATELNKNKSNLRNDPRFVWACVAFWTWAQLSNFSTHLTLRNLRPAGTAQRGIPYGYGFGLISCPNYLFDIFAWLALAVLTGSWVAYGFVVFASYVLTGWAMKRHRAYRKEFGDKYPRNRKALWPFIL
ncbi:3-oxo-5-alpha-steroid 4-dehydrogenase-domain-containing protein [Auriculariales sp. MPI-PUGE-AT-0066]|nr:3-oxo-5-alpha-steroid 4-dehydrogenase-domain-containing protein [Auriculariales sp. MPI-PUGE-AT-0066]